MRNLLPYLCVFGLILSSCSKDPGEGGGGVIKGKLLSKNVRDKDAAIKEDDGEPDENVYIAYGDKTVPDDDVKTAPDGSFEFKYLRKGTYTIFAYSKDPDHPYSDKEIAVIKKVDLGNKDEVNITDFVVYKDADDKGTSTINGKLWAKDYNSAYTAVLNEDVEPNEDVFIIFGKDTIFNERTRSNYDGSYEFRNLREGSYKVYALSDDTTGAYQNLVNPYAAQVAIVKEVKIDSKNQVVTAPIITIIK
jgi:hypothetical protein